MQLTSWEFNLRRTEVMTVTVMGAGDNNQFTVELVVAEIRQFHPDEIQPPGP